jgi:hypothetical protein
MKAQHNTILMSERLRRRSPSEMVRGFRWEFMSIFIFYLARTCASHYIFQFCAAQPLEFMHNIRLIARESSATAHYLENLILFRCAKLRGACGGNFLSFQDR